MAKIYVALIRKGLKTIDDVPERLRLRKLMLMNGPVIRIMIGKH